MPSLNRAAGSPGGAVIAQDIENRLRQLERTAPTTAAVPGLAPVQSVAGKTGAVVLVESDITGLPGDLAAKADVSAVPGLAPVQSVAGKTGTVTLAEGDVSGLVADLAAKAPTSRTLSTTAPLSGGGDLSANRTLAFANQNANRILAGPGSGGAAAPDFRALVAADIPVIAESGVTNLTTDLAALAPLASPALTGNPTAPTQATGNNSTRLASTAFVNAQIAASAPVIVASAATGLTQANNGATVLTYTPAVACLLRFSAYIVTTVKASTAQNCYLVMSWNDGAFSHGPQLYLDTGGASYAAVVDGTVNGAYGHCTKVVRQAAGAAFTVQLFFGAPSTAVSIAVYAKLENLGG